MILENIELPDDLNWTNEYSWSPVARNQRYGVGGSLFITDSVKQAGRPLYFEGEQDTCWVKRAVVEALTSLTKKPGKRMSLVLSDSREFKVMFDHSKGALDVEKVLKGSYFSDNDFYQIKSINFIEVLDE